MNNIIFLHEEKWEDAQNMLEEYRECECNDPDCEGDCEDIGDLLAESNIPRHEIGRMEP